MTDDTRAEFERWGAPFGYYFGRDERGRYRSPTAREAHFAWHAALTAERTRCAEIARSMGGNEGPDYRRACDEIADEIENVPDHR